MAMPQCAAIRWSLDMSYIATGGYSFDCIVAVCAESWPPRQVYADMLMIYDLASDRVSGLNTSYIAMISTTFDGTAYVCGDKLVLTPSRAVKLMFYDLASDKASGLDISRIATRTM